MIILSKPDKDIAYMGNLQKINDKNELTLRNRKRPTDVENKFMVTKGEKGRGGGGGIK